MMENKDYEQVLVTPNEQSIHYATGNYFHLDPDGNEAWQDEVMSNARFIERWLAERDSSVLQIIPYVACITQDGRVLSYQRRGGGEDRLEGRLSIGIGGHVNNTDLVMDNGKISWNTVRNGAIRETTEELGLTHQYVAENLRLVGTIYTPSDDGGQPAGTGPLVGEVHLGASYALPVSSDVEIRDPSMISPQFITKARNTLKYEEWSQLVLRKLDLVRKAIWK